MLFKVVKGFWDNEMFFWHEILMKGHEMIFWGHEIFLEVCFWKLQDAFCGCEMIFGVAWCFGGRKML